MNFFHLDLLAYLITFIIRGALAITFATYFGRNNFLEEGKKRRKMLGGGSEHELDLKMIFSFFLVLVPRRKPVMLC